MNEKLMDFYEGKHVTITGSTGLIGSYTVKTAKELGAYVTAVWNQRPPNEFTRLADVLVRADLFNLKEVRRVFHDDSPIVINCAGLTGGTGSERLSFVGPATALEVNVMHACHLEGVERHGFLSSTTVYPLADHALKENESWDLSHGEIYPKYQGISWSKRFLEQLGKYYLNETGLKVGIVRPTGAYGRYDNFDEESGHVIPGLITRAMREKEKFVIWGDGQDVRDFPHAQDVAMGFLEAIAFSPDAQPFNLGTGHPVTTRETAELILSLVGSKATVELDETKPRAIPKRIVDISLARERLGFEPSISLRDGLKDTIAWVERQ